MNLVSKIKTVSWGNSSGIEILAIHLSSRVQSPALQKKKNLLSMKQKTPLSLWTAQTKMENSNKIQI
jgi:hypothetical protein